MQKKPGLGLMFELILFHFLPQMLHQKRNTLIHHFPFSFSNASRHGSLFFFLFFFSRKKIQNGQINFLLFALKIIIFRKNAGKEGKKKRKRKKNQSSELVF